MTRTLSPLLLLLASLCAALPLPARADDHQAARLLVAPLGRGGVSPEIASALDAILLHEVEALGLHDLVAAADINAMLGAEKMRDAVGCDDVACASEIGSALGARTMLTGSVSRLGGTIFVALTLFDLQTRRTINRVLIERDYDADAFVPALRTAVRTLFRPAPEAAEQPLASPLIEARGEELWRSRLAWLIRSEVECRTLEECRAKTKARVEEIERLLTKAAWRSEDEPQRAALDGRLADLRRQLEALEIALLSRPVAPALTAAETAGGDPSTSSGASRANAGSDPVVQLLLQRSQLRERLAKTTWRWANRDEKSRLESELARVESLIAEIESRAQRASLARSARPSDEEVRLVVEADGLRSKLAAGPWTWDNRDERAALEARLRALDERLERLRRRSPQ
jgi:hypothetical protein